ncbi:hypothetical protein AAVH_40810 [Aphelenchoides avenae]|nr:hypothetical protein AAVH_40810 [Aphelenchus avenae]
MEVVQQLLTMFFVGGFLVPVFADPPLWYVVVFCVCVLMTALAGSHADNPTCLFLYQLAQWFVALAFLVLLVNTTSIVYRLDDSSLRSWPKFLEDCLRERHCRKLMGKEGLR